MDNVEIQKLISGNKWYQSFDFGNGISVKGYTDTNYIWKMANLDCVGKSFIDVGSHYAYYAIQSLREDGIKSVALDRDKKRLIVAQKIAEHFGVHDRFFTFSYDFNKVSSVLPDEKYDIIWCIGLLHYLDNKKEFLEEVVSKCKEVFIVEVFTASAKASSLSKHYDSKVIEFLKSNFRIVEDLGSLKKQFDNRHMYKCYV